MSDPLKYSVAIICALVVEGAAVRAFLDARHDDPEYVAENDNNNYTLGNIGKHNVVICILPHSQTGLVSAAAVARDLLSSFPRIRVGLLVGIAGGAPSSDHDIRLGDIVVSASDNGNAAVFQYDHGKAEQGTDYSIKSFMNQPPPILLAAVSAVEMDYESEGVALDDNVERALERKPHMRQKYQKPDELTDRLYLPDFLHVEKKVDCGKACGDNSSTLTKREQRLSSGPAIHYGMIASANTVMKDALVRDELIKRHPILCFEMEAAGLMNHFPCLVIRGICDYSDSHKNDKWQPYAAMTAAAYARDIIRRIIPSKLERMDAISDTLSSVQQHLEEVKITTSATEAKVGDMHENLTDMNEHITLGALPLAVGASFLSGIQGNKAVCLPRTRTSLLESMVEWSHDLSSQNIFLLDGMAGTGKSTISRTLSRTFAANGALGATFFFNRGIDDCNNISKFFSTIAADLGTRLSTIARKISDVLREDPAIYHKNAEIQFKELVFNPLAKLFMESNRTHPVILIIDALDECHSPDIGILVDILSKIPFETVPGLKILITSRPDFHAREELQILRQHCQRFTLDQIPASMIKNDITIFFECELAKIRHKFNMSVDNSMKLDEMWPQDTTLRELVDMATPLFIIASTVCLFLAHRQLGPPDRQLAKILRDPDRFQATKLDFVYDTVLNQQISEDLTENEKMTICAEFHAIIAPIIVLRNPLPVPVLSAVLNIDHGSIRYRLSFLSSVLNIPYSDDAPITLFHLSFREFLLDTDKRGKTVFWVDDRANHMTLFGHCLRLLQYLDHDLYSLWLSGAINRHSINEVLRPEMQYACVNWVYHVKSSGSLLTDEGPTHLFLKTHFLHWLEALSLLGKSTSAVELITTLKQQVHKINGQLIEEFLDDGIRFVRANSDLLEVSPLLLYTSALLFAPHQTIVRNTFEKLYIEKLSPWIKKIPRIKEHWGESIQTIESGQSYIGKLAISPNSSFLASPSYGLTKIWQSGSGKCLKTIECSGLVAFSDDSMLLAVASRDGKLFVWNTASWELVISYPSSGKEIYSLRFKQHSHTLVSASTDCTKVWNIQAKTLQPLKHLPHELEATQVELSNDLTSVAQRFASNAVRILNFESHMTVCCFGIEGNITEMVFSPNDLLLAAISPESTVVWCASTGAQIHLLDIRLIRSLAFSSDSKLLAQGGFGITIWHMDTGQHIFTFDSDRDLFVSVVFSADNSLLVSASHNALQIWKTDNIAAHSASDAGLPVITRTFCSPNLRYIGVKRSQQPELWDTNLKLFTHKLKPCLFYFFSPDSSYVALSPAQNKLEIFSITPAQLELSFDLGLACSSMRNTTAIAFSQDSKLLVVPVMDALEIWSISGKGRTRSLEIDTENIWSTALSPNSELIAVFANEEINIHCLSSNQCICRFDVDESSLRSLLFSQDSKRILGFGSDQEKLMVLDIERSQVLCCVDICPDLAQVARFDGDLITTNCGQVQLFATENGEKTEETQLHPSTVEMSCRWRGWGLSSDRVWLTWNGFGVLWIPVYYRPCGIVVDGCNLTLVCASGMVYSMELGDPGIFET